MPNLNRREFLKQGTAVSALAFLPFSCLAGSMTGNSNFKMSLNPGTIGISVNQDQLLQLAIQNGFEAIVPLFNDLLKKGRQKAVDFYEEMKSVNISWDALNLPVEFRKDEQTFQSGLKELSKSGPLLQRLNISRCSTWIMPTHDELTYLKNFRQHASRLKATADVLSDFNVKLGIEYVGPKTLMAWKRHPFISSLKEARELIAESGSNNIGIQLDSFHWFCAGESTTDLKSLQADEIVTCDLNDAVKGRTSDEQLDYERELPGVSGVIDLKSFLTALNDIGYDGPIRAEPFNAKLNGMNANDAIALTKKQMQATFELI
ncbi:MAG: sugar phosphate isomerase/epimerase family protein [Bacteroidota bacterium]